MTIIFFGNTKYSVIDAEALHKHFGLAAIVTIPDKEVKKKYIPSPTKTFALAHNIPVIEAKSLNTDVIQEIKHLQPDFFVVADYGIILPQAILEIPTCAPLNIHHSLLPKYRGASPVPSALLAGEKKTGVTIIIMNTKVDDGDIVAQKEYEIQPYDTSDSVLTLLNELGSKAVIEVIEHFAEIAPKKQESDEATFTHYMKKQDGYIDIQNPPSLEQIDRMIRAYYPWPGVWTLISLNGKQVRIKLLPLSRHSRAGGNPDPRIRKDDEMESFLIQVEGKKPQTIREFLNGYPEAKQWLERLFGKRSYSL